MQKTARDRERIRKRVIAQNDIANPEKCNGGSNFLFLLDYIYLIQWKIAAVTHTHIHINSKEDQTKAIVIK